MNTAALRAAAKVLSQNLLAEFESQLRLGALCSRDYSSEGFFTADGSTVLQIDQPRIPPHLWADGAPPSAVKTFNIRLTHIKSSFVVGNVSELVIQQDMCRPDIQVAVGELADQVDDALIKLYSGVTYNLPGDGTINQSAINDIDRILFDKSGDGAVHMVTNRVGREQYRRLIGDKEPTINVVVPDAEVESDLQTGVAFTPGAICLVTRQFKHPSNFYSAVLDKDDLGLSLSIAPHPSMPNALDVGVHLLYAVSIARPEQIIGIPLAGVSKKVEPPTPAGSRPAVHAASSAGIGRSLTSTTVDAVVQAAPTMLEVRNGLEQAIDDALIDRLENTLDSLTDTIEDDRIRLRTALRLLQKIDGIQVGRLVESCYRQLQSLETERQRFRQSADVWARAEIASREQELRQAVSDIQRTREVLAELEDRKSTLEIEILYGGESLADEQKAFDDEVRRLTGKVMLLEVKLEDYLPGETGQQQAAN